MLLPWLCLGQVVDYEHNWAHREGGAGDDFGRGVALWHDGTVCQLSETATGPGGDSEMKLTLSWRTPGGSLQTTARVDGGTGAGGEIFPRDIAAGNNFVDQGAGGYPSYRTAWMHSVGSFVGQIDIGGSTLTSGASGTTVGAFVSRDSVWLPSSPFFSNDWATAFTSTDVIEALTVASSPPGLTGGDSGTASSSAAAAGPTGPGGPAIYRPLIYPPPPGMLQPGLMTTVGVGGYFKGVATFPTSASSSSTVNRTAPGGYENGYVTLMLQQDFPPGGVDGRVLHNGPDGPDDSAAILQIASPNGDTRVTGIAIDPKDYTVAVTGWFEASDTNFDPKNGSFTPGSHAGGRDIFVALYEPNWYGRLSLRWLYVTGTEYDDEGTSVAFDSSGAVYATGWKGDGWGTGDLWLARFNKPTGGTFPRSISPAWDYTWPSGTADDRGLDVAVDHLDRVVVTGRFGIAELPSYCLDFNPRSGVDIHCTVDGADIFVMRFLPNGIYDWGYSVGSDKDDIGAAVATDPMGTGRIAIGGTFGIGASSGYTVDFDPAGGGATLQSAGGGDSFISALDQPVPEDVLSQVSFVFDNSGSVDEDKYIALMTSLRSKLIASGNVPTDGSVVLGAAAYSNAESAQPMMPWTVIDSPQTLSAFANRLAQQALPSGGNNRLPEGIQVVGDQFQFMTAPGAYRHLVAIVEDASLGNPRDEIDDLFLQDLIDQSSGIATFLSSTYGDGRDYILNEVAESVAQFVAADPLEGNLGMAAEVPDMEHPDLVDLLDRFIKRVTVCPGDFDRDGFVDQGDRTAFQFAAGTGDDYADWNFDGTIDVGTGPGEIDEPKFSTGWALGCGGP